jgi:hypothetical protein
MENPSDRSTPRLGQRLATRGITLSLASFGSLLGAVVGFAAAAALAAGLGGAFGMSDFEGGRSMFALFSMGPLGGIAGFFAGTWLILRLRGRFSVIEVLGYALVSLIPIGLFAGAIAGLIYFNNAGLYSDGSKYALEFEIMLPPGAKVPSRVKDVGIMLDTDKNVINGDLDPSTVRRDSDRPVLVGEVELYYRTSRRYLKLQMPGEPDRIFILPFSASPSPFEAFTAWRHVDLIEEPEDHPRKAVAGDAFDIRYRLPDPHKPVPYIEFEIRLPANARLPDGPEPLHIAQRRDDIDDDWGDFLNDNWRRLDGDRPVLMGGTAIRKPTKHPKITLKLLEGPLLVFDLDFPANGAPTAGFGPWKPVAFLETYGEPPRRPGPDDQFELRYRIDAPR